MRWESANLEAEEKILAFDSQMDSQTESLCKNQASSNLRHSSVRRQYESLSKDPKRENAANYGKPALKRSENKCTRIKSLFQDHETRSNQHESKNVETKPQIPAASNCGVPPGFKKLKNTNYVNRRFSNVNQRAQKPP